MFPKMILRTGFNRFEMSRFIDNVESSLHRAQEKFILKQKKYQALLYRWNNLGPVLAGSMENSMDQPDSRMLLSAEYWDSLDLEEWGECLNSENVDQLRELIMKEFGRFAKKEDVERYNREFDFGICWCDISYRGHRSGYKGQDTQLKITEFNGVDGDSEINYLLDDWDVGLKYFMGDDEERAPSRNADWGDWDSTRVSETVQMPMIWAQPKAK